MRRRGHADVGGVGRAGVPVGRGVRLAGGASLFRLLVKRDGLPMT